jgi:hypothetical protein
MQLNKKDLLDDLAWQLGRLNSKVGFRLHDINSRGRLLMLFDKTGDIFYQDARRVDKLSHDEIMQLAGEMLDKYLGVN